jgi:hypothetical protein
MPGGPAIIGFDHLVAPEAKHPPNQAPDCGLVLDEQDSN